MLGLTAQHNACLRSTDTSGLSTCHAQGARQLMSRQTVLRPAVAPSAEVAPQLPDLLQHDLELGRASVPNPSNVRRCRTVNAVVGMLHKHHKSASPRFWVTALCHLSELLAEENQQQQIPQHSWSQLQRSLLFLVDPQSVKVKQQQRRWKQIQEWIQEQKAAGTWVDPQQQQQMQSTCGGGSEQLQTSAPPERQQQQQQQQQQAPILQFTASQVTTLLWALAHIHRHLHPQQQQQLTVPQHSRNYHHSQQQQQNYHHSQQQQQQLQQGGLQNVLWPPILQAVAANSCKLNPGDTAVLLWAILRLNIPTPAGWLSDLVYSQTAAFHTYPTRTLALLLYCCGRRSVKLHSSTLSAALTQIQQDLPSIQHQDLSMIVWSLAALKVRPAAQFMAAAVAASKRHLSTADWSEVTALLVGAARLGFCPSGPWLLEFYDQLYWTVDQLELRQLVSVIWALGRLRVTAVPQELLERLVAFARLQLQPLLQQHQQHDNAATPAVEDANSSVHTDASSSSSSSREIKQQYATAKLLYQLLQGLAWLRVSLNPKMQIEVADSLLPALLVSQGSLTHVHVPAVLNACAVLGVRLSPVMQAAVSSKLQQLQPEMRLKGLAVGLRAAVQLGCSPDQQWLEQWMDFTGIRLNLAAADELVMVLRCCVVVGHRPPSPWLLGVFVRLQELLLQAQQVRPESLVQQQGQQQQGQPNPRVYGCLSGGQLAALVQHLVDLGVKKIPRGLLGLMWSFMDNLEQCGSAAAAAQRFQQHARQLAPSHSVDASATVD